MMVESPGPYFDKLGIKIKKKSNNSINNINNVNR